MDVKPWWQSLTIIGAAVITLSTAILPMFGANDVADKIQQQREDLLKALELAGQSIGVIMVVIGRLKAKTNLTLK